MSERKWNLMPYYSWVDVSKALDKCMDRIEELEREVKILKNKSFSKKVTDGVNVYDLNEVAKNRKR